MTNAVLRSSRRHITKFWSAATRFSASPYRLISRLVLAPIKAATPTQIERNLVNVRGNRNPNGIVSSMAQRKVFASLKRHLNGSPYDQEVFNSPRFACEGHSSRSDYLIRPRTVANHTPLADIRRLAVTFRSWRWSCVGCRYCRFSRSAV